MSLLPDILDDLGRGGDMNDQDIVEDMWKVVKCNDYLWRRGGSLCPSPSS